MDQNETVQKVKVIKKYVNRKFYDAELSQYVTLGDIYKLVIDGYKVMVIENKTKRDITNKTLLASLVETESEREDLATDDVEHFIKNGLKRKNTI